MILPPCESLDTARGKRRYAPLRVLPEIPRAKPYFPLPLLALDVAVMSRVWAMVGPRLRRRALCAPFQIFHFRSVAARLRLPRACVLLSTAATSDTRSKPAAPRGGGRKTPSPASASSSDRVRSDRLCPEVGAYLCSCSALGGSSSRLARLDPKWLLSCRVRSPPQATPHSALPKRHEPTYFWQRRCRPSPPARVCLSRRAPRCANMILPLGVVAGVAGDATSVSIGGSLTGSCCARCAPCHPTKDAPQYQLLLGALAPDFPCGR